jgi:hypothetical protein
MYNDFLTGLIAFYNNNNKNIINNYDIINNNKE